MEQYFLNEADKVRKQGKNLMKIWYGPVLRVYLMDSDAVKVISFQTKIFTTLTGNTENTKECVSI